jgi:hypothetical protein
MDVQRNSVIPLPPISCAQTRAASRAPHGFAAVVLSQGCPHGVYGNFFDGIPLSCPRRIQPNLHLMRASFAVVCPRSRLQRRSVSAGPARCLGPRCVRGIRKIAHQVSVRLDARRSGEPEPRAIRCPLKKFLMAPCRTSVPLPLPTAHAGSCRAGRGAMPSAEIGARWLNGRRCTGNHGNRYQTQRPSAARAAMSPIIPRVRDADEIASEGDLLRKRNILSRRGVSRASAVFLPSTRQGIP